MSVQLPESPYKGLAPFGDTAIDAKLFFGRERDVEIVAANVIASRLTVLYGPSGVGKSSLLSAAVVRKLRELPEHPLVVVFSAWSASPGAAIAAAVCAEAGVESTDDLHDAVERACAVRGDVFLLLDQSEEYFLYHPQRGPFEAELAGLLQGSARVNVLLSLRDDALAKLDRFKASIPGILGNYLRLDRLTREAAHDAIVKPLASWHELAGEIVEVEPALTESVLDQVAVGRISAGLGGGGTVAADTSEERIEAPYLQLVLERIWEVEREQGSAVLRAATLERLGGAAEIVALHLEGAMDSLTPAQQEIASELLHQLVTPSGAKIAHSATDLADYARVAEPEARSVLDALATRRILRPGDDGSYEIYHDVLAAPILAWRERHVHAQELVEAHRRSRRLATLATAAVAALVITTLIAVFALVQRGNAREQARAAHARELDAAALSLLPTDPELGLVLARESAALSPTATAEDVLREALTSSRLRSVVDLGKPLLAAAAVGPETTAVAVDGSVIVTRQGSKTEVATGVPAKDASISAAGEVLLTGGDGRLRVVTGGAPRLVPHVAHALGADLSASGALAAVRLVGKPPFASPKVQLVDLRTGKVRLQVDHGEPATAAAVGVGDTLLATGGNDHVVRLWRISDGRLLHVLTGHVGPITAIAFSPRGSLLATASTDGIARVWDTGTGQPLSVLSGHGNYLADVAFSADGDQVVTASLDRTARTWRAETGDALATFAGSPDAVVSAVFAAAGFEVVTAGADGSVRRWDAVVQPKLALVTNLGAPVTGLRFGARSSSLFAIAGGRSERITLPRGPSIDLGAAPPAGAPVRGPAGQRATIQGKQVVIRHADGTTVTLRGHTRDVTSVAFSDDGKRAVTASLDHDARVWDARTGAPLQVLRGHFGPVSDARFSPDARWVVTAGPITAGLFNVANGRLVLYLSGNVDQLLSVAFAPDGVQVATGSKDGAVRLWRCPICGRSAPLLALADARLAGTGRVLSGDERRRYGL